MLFISCWEGRVTQEKACEVFYHLGLKVAPSLLIKLIKIQSSCRTKQRPENVVQWSSQEKKKGILGTPTVFLLSSHSRALLSGDILKPRTGPSCEDHS